VHFAALASRTTCHLRTRTPRWPHTAGALGQTPKLSLLVATAPSSAKLFRPKWTPRTHNEMSSGFPQSADDDTTGVDSRCVCIASLRCSSQLSASRGRRTHARWLRASRLKLSTRGRNNSFWSLVKVSNGYFVGKIATTRRRRKCTPGRTCRRSARTSSAWWQRRRL
jgi:hypothetical protein